MAEPRSIPNLDGLTTLANRSGVDIKPTLLRVMTDLYVQKPWHTAEEEQHYTELALRLIDAVDAPTRTVVASKLAAYTSPPASVMRRLRKDSSTEITPAAPRHPSAATAATELCELFLTADAEERRLILVNLPYASLSPAEPIAPAAARSAIQRLEAAALSHNNAGFVQELERTLGVSRTLAQRLIDDASGEPIVVVARALTMPADVLQRILLCLNPAISQSVLRVYELARLHDEIEPQAALRLLAIWRSAHKPSPQSQSAPQPTSRHAAARPASAHQSQLWHVEERSILPARPKIRWEEHVPTRKAENQ